MTMSMNAWHGQPVHEVAPLEGFRHVKVTDRHTALDYAQVLKELSDTHFPDAKKICLVQDISPTPASPRSLSRRRSTPAGRKVEWTNL